MLLKVEKGFRGGTCHTIYRHAKASNKYMKEYNKNKESSYFKYWDVNNLYGQAISQKLLVNGFGQVEYISGFHKEFIKSYNDESDEGYFHEVDIQYPEKLCDFHNDLLFLP